MRSQLRRATERYGSFNSKMLSHALAQLVDEDIDQAQSSNRVIGSLHVQNCGGIDDENMSKLDAIPESDGSKSYGADLVSYKSERLGNSSDSSDIDVDGQDSSATNSLEEIKKPDPIVVPEDFLCPISLELMRDPVIVATGQV